VVQFDCYLCLRNILTYMSVDVTYICRQYFETVGLAPGRASCLWKLSHEVLVWLSVSNEVQMICVWSSWCHCHPIVSCFIKIQIGLTLLVLAYPGCPGEEAVKWLPVCLTYLHKNVNWEYIVGLKTGNNSLDWNCGLLAAERCGYILLFVVPGSS